MLEIVMTEPAQAPPETPERVPSLRAFRELVRERCGLSFGDTRTPPLARAVKERMQRRSVASEAAYLAMVTSSEVEWRDLLDLLVNQETSFFRHPPTFEALVSVVVPSLVSNGPRALSIWSAGCSTGEEPYSLAMSMLESASGPFRVHGTDLCRRGLEVARLGRYRLSRAPNLSEACRARFFSRIESAGKVLYQVKDEVRETVSFSPVNLADSSAFWPLAQDVIVCQNVLIYFEPEAQLDVVRRLASRLSPGGFLVLGPGEVAGFRDPSLTARRVGDVLLHQRVG